MLIALLLSIVPAGEALSDTAAEIEANHFYDCDGRKIFTQFIFWEWVNGHRVVKDWRLDKGFAPRRHGDGWRLRFQDGERMRVIDAPVFFESWSQHDVELLDRERWPVDVRSKLLSPVRPP